MGVHIISPPDFILWLTGLFNHAEVWTLVSGPSPLCPLSSPAEGHSRRKKGLKGAHTHLLFTHHTLEYTVIERPSAVSFQSTDVWIISTSPGGPRESPWYDLKALSCQNMVEFSSSNVEIWEKKIYDISYRQTYQSSRNTAGQPETNLVRRRVWAETTTVLSNGNSTSCSCLWLFYDVSMTQLQSITELEEET